MRHWATVLLVSLGLIGCFGETEAPETPKVAEATKVQHPDETPPAPEQLVEGHHPALLNPSLASETAPDTFKVKFETTQGSFVMQVTRAWAPMGADRFYNLVNIGFYDGLCFFRAIKGFMVQYGIHGDPRVSTLWRDARIDDDPVTQQNTRGRVTFATAGPNTRTTQIFINYSDRNVMLDGQGFAPFAEIIDGMDVVDALYTGYGETPNQGLIQKVGNAYLNKQFSRLDHIQKVSIVE